MSGFTLDTSAGVWMPPPQPGNVGAVSRHLVKWSELSPFVQGYVEALLSPPLILVTFNEPTGELPWKPMSTRNLGFSDLSPEALALILRDCEDCKDVPGCASLSNTPATGEMFWDLRQEGDLPRWPALTPYLSDDGKVCLR